MIKITEVISPIADVIKAALSQKLGVIALAFLVVVSSCSMIAYGVYETQKEELGRIAVKKLGQERFIAKFDDSKFNLEIGHLVRRSGAEGASVWLVDLSSYSKKMIYRQIRTGEEKSFYGVEYPLFYTDQNILSFSRVQQGEIQCMDVVPETDFGYYMIEKKITFVCMAPVPPSIDQFIGIIQLEFRAKPVMLIKGETDESVRRTFSNYLTFASKKIIKY